jgi:MFS-type transporter involved in bile tolerance (Atg22 family)
VSWFSRKQKSVALSSAEAEYMAASQASCEALWLRKMLVGLFGLQLRPTVIYCDVLTACLAQRSTHYHEDYSMSETEMVLLGVLYTST